MEVDPLTAFPFNIFSASLMIFLPNSCIFKVFKSVKPGGGVLFLGCPGGYRLGYRKSEIESKSTDVTSGMSTDEGEENSRKGKKLVKHKDMERKRKGKGMLSELLPLYTLYERESITCRLNLRYVEVGGRLFEAGCLLPFSALRMGLCD